MSASRDLEGLRRSRVQRLISSGFNHVWHGIGCNKPLVGRVSSMIVPPRVMVSAYCPKWKHSIPAIEHVVLCSMENEPSAIPYSSPLHIILPCSRMNPHSNAIPDSSALTASIRRGRACPDTRSINTPNKPSSKGMARGTNLNRVTNNPSLVDTIHTTDEAG